MESRSSIALSSRTSVQLRRSLIGSDTVFNSVKSLTVFPELIEMETIDRSRRIVSFLEAQSNKVTLQQPYINYFISLP